MPRNAHRVPIPSLTSGWVERADADVAIPGTLRRAQNVVPTPVSRLVTRGGSRVMNTFTDATPTALTDILACRTWSVTGAALVGWISSTAKHWVQQFSSNLQTLDSRADLGWDTTGPARPVIVEMYEELFICDANRAFANRHPLKRVNNTPTVNTVQEKFDGTTARDFKPYTIEEFMGVLFAAGYDSGATADLQDDGAYLRHSLLGQSPYSGTPTATSPWDVDSWALVGASKVPILGLKKGGNILLVAKEFELYRVWGTPLADVGFQFNIEPVDNELGVGVSNALAIDYAQGYWYGFGKAGPFRTDGRTVEQLSLSIAETWATFDGDVDKAWVCAHPDRQCVLFGVPAGSNYPTTLWVYDTIRNQWAGVWNLGSTQIFSGYGVVDANPVGPSAAPTAGTQTTVSETSITAGWSNGDATCKTEVWYRNITDGGAYTLYDLADAGATTHPVTGLSAYHQYEFKFRHKKNGLFSDFSGTANGYTKLAPPNFYAYGHDSTNKAVLRAKQNNNHAVHGATDIAVERGALSAQAEDFASGNSTTTEGGSVEMTFAGSPSADGTYDIKMYVSVTIDENATEPATIKLTVKIYVDPDGMSGYSEVATIQDVFQTSTISGPPPFETNTATFDPYTKTISAPTLVAGGKIKIEAFDEAYIGAGATGSFILRGGDGAGANPESYNGVNYSTAGSYSALTSASAVALGVMSPDLYDTTATNGVEYPYRARAVKTGWGGGDNSDYVEDEDGDNANEAAGGETDAGMF